MTALLLHVGQHRRSAKQQQQFQSQPIRAGRRLCNFSTPVGRIRQPGLAAFANYFAFSEVAPSRYTPALAADLPSQAAMLAADEQAMSATSAFCSQQQRQRQRQRQQHGHSKAKTSNYFNFNSQKQQRQQQLKSTSKLGPVARSYSDPNLPSNASADQLNCCIESPTNSLKSPLDTELSASATLDSCGAVFFDIKADSDNRLERPSTLIFRHSFNCLLDLLNGDAAKDGESDDEVEGDESGAPKSAPPLHHAVSDPSDSGGVVKKRVTFADDLGKPLQQVRVFSEPSCAPPKFLSIRAVPADPDAPEAEAGQSVAGQFRCQFEQPSSKYILFRENVEKNCVSLSNLYFDELTAKGSVYVKNISFKKRVFVRVTFDEWASYRDVEATYASSQDSRQDSFVFSFSCPANSERGFQFCVCFEADGQAFWDNNGGANYKVTPVKKAASFASGRSRAPVDPYTSDYKPNYAAVTDFAEFCVWDHFADRVYY